MYRLQPLSFVVLVVVAAVVVVAVVQSQNNRIKLELVKRISDTSIVHLNNGNK